MENTKQTPQEKSTLSNILEQIKIVLVIYGIVIIIHMVSIGSKLPDLAKSTVVRLCNGSDCDYLEKCCEKT